MVSTAPMSLQDPPNEKLVQLGKRTAEPSAVPAQGGVLRESGTGPKVFFETYVCQMNVADSNMLSGLLGDEGYRKAK